MAENQSTYGLPNIRDLLSTGIGQLEDLTTGITSGIYGGASDITGMGSELLGLPDDIAQFYRGLAQDSYKKSAEGFKSILDPKTLAQRNIERILNTPERDLIESMLVDPNRMKSFEPPEPTSDLGKKLSEIDSLLSSASPRVPPEGRPQTVAEEKASAEESLLKEAQQSAQAEEQLFGKEKEDFRAKEEARLQGTPPTPENKEQIEEDAFKMIMEENLRLAGKGAKDIKGGSGARDLDFYKKEFAKATGVDISGKPDKSNFLMALGLGLMQNRAGKGFNVGKILGAVGESAQKAMPELKEAQKEAKANMIAAGKYAMQAQAKDAATAAAASKKLNETKEYFVVPTDGKGGLTTSAYINNYGNGRLMTFSNGQLAQLQSDPQFSNNYALLPASDFRDVLSKSMETKEAADLYLTKNPRDINLIGSDDEAGSSLFNIRVYDPNVNTNPDGTPIMVGDGVEQYKAFALALQDLQKAKGKFAEGLGLAKDATVFRFALDKAESLAGAFGIDVSKGANPTEKLQLFLRKLQAQNAKAILGEAGKTISDADRKLVADIVGDRTIFNNPDLLVEKVNQLFNDIIVKKERQIFAGLEMLDRFQKRNVTKTLYGSFGTLSPEEQEERIRLRKKYGLDI